MGNGGSTAYTPLNGTSTTTRQKQWWTKCICVGCGCNDHMCAPAFAVDVRCCCFEAGMQVDPSRCQKCPDDFCAARFGCKLLPAVVDVTNPIVDNHELVVVVEKKIF
mmetsp:Transcript_101882/g.293424  ORF Transcript_101882/g.293424 Transcript_101882/m.293424 type:complete len:107 (-) Transcript_101882:209-529(-)